jgi:general secretion pathway protein C
MGLGALIVFQGIELRKTHKILPEDLKVPGAESSHAQVADFKQAGKATAKPRRNVAPVIIKRNLFRVRTDKPLPAKSPQSGQVQQELEKTRLNLYLWGTVTGAEQSDSWAVIEEQAKQSQALYRVGDKIQGATIKTIYRNRIILTLDGKDQVLEASTDKKQSIRQATTKGRAPSRPVKQTAQGDVRPPGELIRAINNRPYHKNGTPSGLLLYGLRSNSDVMALGLRNGDIIKTINGMDIMSQRDLATATQGLDTSPDIIFTLMRQGRLQNVIFNIEGRTFTTQSTKE